MCREGFRVLLVAFEHAVRVFWLCFFWTVDGFENLQMQVCSPSIATRLTDAGLPRQSQRLRSLDFQNFGQRPHRCTWCRLEACSPSPEPTNGVISMVTI